jgi:pre-rRNA-processing protein TSR1
LKEWRDRKREEQDDLEFPDEIDTPMDIPAHTRFQRYRGLRSMRTSPWDPYENLPRDYARIFQFEDFRRTERNVKRRCELEGYGVQVWLLLLVSPACPEVNTQAGTRVTIYLKDVPSTAASSPPLMLFGLLPHEHKQTVLHFAVQRNTEYNGTVRSKDPLVLCVGPRRLRVRPVYSEHTRGGGKGPNNLHKFERYLRHGDTHVASTFGPVVYGKQPCMLLRETEDAQGTCSCFFVHERIPTTRFTSSSPSRGHRQLPWPRPDTDHREADSPHRPPLQSAQEDSDDPVHVLQPRYVLS